MLKLNKTPRMKESAETTRWYMEIALAVNQLVDVASNVNSGGGVLPVGSVIFHGSTTLPSGYLKANGALISRSSYSALFAAIGTTFGVGDGSTTFALPDLRAEFIRGLDDGRGVDTSRAIGSAQTQAIQSHAHAYRTQYILGPGAGINGEALTGSAASQPLSAYSAIPTQTTDAAGSAETRPRNVALLACIKY